MLGVVGGEYITGLSEGTRWWMDLVILFSGHILLILYKKMLLMLFNPFLILL